MYTSYLELVFLGSTFFLCTKEITQVLSILCFITSTLAVIQVFFRTFGLSSLTVLLDYCNIFNLYGNVLHILQYIIYNTHVLLLVSITQLNEILGECSEYGLILVDQMEKAMYNS